MAPHIDRPQVPLDRMPVEQALSCVEPLTAASTEQLMALSPHALRVTRAAGTVLVAEGARSDGLYVILRGRVNLTRDGGTGRGVILSSLSVGDSFGEVCVVDEPMLMAAVCSVTTELLVIPAHALRGLALSAPATLMRVAKLINQRARDLENVASELALHDVEVRLCRTLTRMALRQRQRSLGVDAWVVSPMPTQTELARMVGSCRETVSRTLTTMARNGMVESRGRRMLLAPAMIETHAQA